MSLPSLLVSFMEGAQSEVNEPFRASLCVSGSFLSLPLFDFFTVDMMTESSLAWEDGGVCLL